MSNKVSRAARCEGRNSRYKNRAQQCDHAATEIMHGD